MVALLATQVFLCHSVSLIQREGKQRRAKRSEEVKVEWFSGSTFYDVEHNVRSRATVVTVGMHL